MKSIITLTAITILSALALVGCDQKSSDSPTVAPATNSNMSDASSGNTNLPATNSLPDVHTNN